MDAEQRAQEAVAECLRQPQSAWEAGIDEACNRHPDLAPRIRAIYSALQQHGLVDAGMPQQFGEFRLLRRLGDGAMGWVFEAEQGSVRRRVALKVLTEGGRLSADGRERFEREARALAALDHPGVVRVLSYGIENGVPYYAMDLLAGRSLADVLRDLEGRGPAGLDPAAMATAFGMSAGSIGGFHELTFRLVARLARALGHAHSRGVLHRDVKPANIIVTTQGEAVLIDFGLARMQGDAGITRTGVRLGSLAYLAPELWSGSTREHEERSDLYALGLVLWEALALRPAFAATTEIGLREAVVGGHLPSLRSLNRSLSRDAETVCLKAIDVDPMRRYATGVEFAEDLENVLGLRPVRARRRGFASRTLLAVRRRPWLGVVSVMFLLLVVVLVWQGSRELYVARVERDYASYDRQWQALAAIEALSYITSVGSSRLWPTTTDNLPAFESCLRIATEARARLEEAAVRCERDRGRIGIVAKNGLLPRGGLTIPDRDRDNEITGYLYDETALTGLSALRQSISLLESRMELARMLSFRCVESETARAAWVEIAGLVRSDPAFSGFELVPQSDLIPLGRDALGRFVFWHVTSGEQPGLEANAPLHPTMGIALVLMPGNADEPPCFVARSPMTRGQWKRVMRGGTGKRDGDDAPVTEVTYDECESAATRYMLAMPTESQLVRAAAVGLLPDPPVWCIPGTGARRGLYPAATPLAPEQRFDPRRDAGLPGFLHRGLGFRPIRRVDLQARTVRAERCFSASSFERFVGYLSASTYSSGVWDVLATEGNDGVCVEAAGFAGWAFLLFIDPEAVWDPKLDGAWTDVDLAIDAQTVSGFGVGASLQPVIQQGDAIFFPNDDRLRVGASAQWRTMRGARLSPEAFFQVLPRDWESDRSMYRWGEGPRPDLGPTAAPMRFGFGVYHSHAGMYRQRFDNVRITVRRRE